MSSKLSNINRLEQKSSSSRVDLSVDSDRCLAELTFTGSVTLDLINGAFLKLIDHPSFRTNMHACYDYSQAIIETSMRDVEAHLQFVLQNLSKRGSNYKLALVSCETLNTGILNVYKVRISKSTMEAKLFVTKKQALQWLTSNQHITEQNKNL